MTDLEALFQDAAALAEEGAGPASELMGRVRKASSAYRRRRRAALAVPVLTAVVGGVVAAPSLVSRRHDSLVPAGGSTATSASPGGCTATGGGTCVPLSSAPPTTRPTQQAAGACSYRETTPDAPTVRYRQTTVGRKVGLPPATPGPLPRSASIHTNRGDITIALRPDTACTVNSFVHLVQHNYYDDTACFRLTTGGNWGIYILQCGDPSAAGGNGAPGNGGPGYAFDDEHLVGTTYPAGTVAMANAGPDSNGSQFFLVYQDSELDPSYTVFGHITSGLAVLTEVAANGSTPSGDGHPNVPVTIASVTLQ